MGVFERAMDGAHERAVTDLDVSEMLDILYDFVEFGAAAAATVDLEAIQDFLHQHARDPKTRAQFHEFFLEHGIEARTVMEPQLPLYALTPAVVPEDAPTPLPTMSEVRLRAPQAQASELLPETQWALRWLGAVAAVLLVALLGVSVLGVKTVRQLRSELALAQRSAEEQRVQTLAQQQRAELAERELEVRGVTFSRVQQENRALEQAVHALSQVKEPTSKRPRRSADQP